MSLKSVYIIEGLPPMPTESKASEKKTAKEQKTNEVRLFWGDCRAGCSLRCCLMFNWLCVWVSVWIFFGFVLGGTV